MEWKAGYFRAICRTLLSIPNSTSETPCTREKSMAERVCDVCGKKKDMDGDKTCQKSHFICKSCVYSGVILISEKKHCPLDKTPLR